MGLFTKFTLPPATVATVATRQNVESKKNVADVADVARGGMILSAKKVDLSLSQLANGGQSISAFCRKTGTHCSSRLGIATSTCHNCDLN